jgi:hypothetical protein
MRLYLGGLGRKPSPEDALQGMNAFIESMKIENCTLDPEMEAILRVE